MKLLAHKDGLGLVLGALLRQGALCPKCSFATRVTSRQWATCKRCGEKVKRKQLPAP
jgi:uncharacterized paraquat-inducible protein A